MTSESTSIAPKPQRILACVGCQQRKIRCERKFPCSHCVKSRMVCVPATKLPRRRRRRFPEQELLDQLRKYEELLQKHNIDFEPLLQDPHNTQSSLEHDDHLAVEQGGTPESSSAAVSSPPGKVPEAKSFWHAVHQKFGTEEDEDEEEGEYPDLEDMIAFARDTIFLDDNSLLLGRQIPIDLSPLHPDPAQIFRLWQLFLDNVNPLLRVIHTPTMQVRIVEAIGDVKSIQPVMEALMFAIYSMAILSLDNEECFATFASSKSELLSRYQFGCQQALQNCGFLRTGNRECLTAFFLYMFSYVHSSDPKALSSSIAIAIRIAQRMKIDREEDCAKHDFLEGEMRRRLWWALILFDVRASQLAGEKSSTLLPVFDCRVPLNINDAILRPGIKEQPTIQEQPTEAIYVVVKATIADCMRYTGFNIAYNAPELTPLARVPQAPQTTSGEQLLELEKMIEERFLKHCNPDDPLHFLTIWESRCIISKWRLMEYYSTNFEATWTEEQSDTACQLAIRFLECGSKTLSSPLAKGFRWMSQFYFPFPAYIHLIKHLKRAPLDQHADRAWNAMSTNFNNWLEFGPKDEDTIFRLMGKMVLSAWAARESALIQRNEMIFNIPPIVAKMRGLSNNKREKNNTPSSSLDWLAEGGTGTDNMLQNNTDCNFAAMPTPFDAASNGPMSGLLVPWMETFGGGSTNGSMKSMNEYSDPNLAQLDWTASMMNWGVGQKPAGW